MRIERKNISRNLPKKGFVKKEESHHIYFHHQFNGVDTGICTYVSHGKKHKDYDGKILSKIKKQLKLNSTQEVADLVNCPMSEDQYNQILRDKDLIPDN